MIVPSGRKWLWKVAPGAGTTLGRRPMTPKERRRDSFITAVCCERLSVPESLLQANVMSDVPSKAASQVQEKAIDPYFQVETLRATPSLTSHISPDCTKH